MHIGTDPLRIILPALALEACRKRTADEGEHKYEYILYRQFLPSSGCLIRRLAGPTCMRSTRKIGEGQKRLTFCWPSELSAIIDNRPHGHWHVPLRNVHGQNCICELQVVVQVQAFAQLLIRWQAPFACSFRQKHCKPCGTIAASQLAPRQWVYQAKARPGHLVCPV